MKNHFGLIPILFLSLCYHQVLCQSFSRQIDSLHKELDSSSGAARVDILNEISYTYRRITPDSVLKYGRMAEKLSKELQYIKGEAIANKNLGIGYFKKLSIPSDSIIFYYRKAIQKAAIVEDYYTQAACLNNIALIQQLNDNIYLAIKSYLDGIIIYEEKIQKEDRLKALMLGNLAGCYFTVLDTTKAHHYYQEAIRITYDQNLEQIQAMYLPYYAQLLYFIGEKEESIEAITRSIKLAKKFEDLESIVHNNISYAEILSREKKWESALNAASEALAVCENQELSHMTPSPLYSLSKIYRLKGDYQTAVDYGEQAMQRVDRSGSFASEMELTKHMTELYELLNQPKKALQYAHKYNHQADSLRNTQLANMAADLEMKYQVKNKEQEIELLHQAQRFQKSRANLFFISLLIALVLISIILYLLYRKTQLSRTISSKNIEIVEKNTELEKYIESNLQLENFAFIASHDLKTPLRSIVSFAQLLEKDARDDLGEIQREYLSFITNGTKELSLIIDDLLNYSRVQTQPLSPAMINSKELLESCIQHLKLFHHEKNIDIEIVEDQIPDHFFADPLKMKQLFTNLLMNAVKFQQPNTTPKITISTHPNPKGIQFSISDNGIGIEPEYHERIFLIFKRLHTKKVYNGSGMGLAICKKIAEQHQGEIWVDSELGQGSTFHFYIPRNIRNGS